MKSCFMWIMCKMLIGNFMSQNDCIQVDSQWMVLNIGFQIVIVGSAVINALLSLNFKELNIKKIFL